MNIINIEHISKIFGGKVILMTFPVAFPKERRSV